VRPSPLAALAVGLAAFSFALTGCATGAGASVEPPAAVPSSEPTPTPTPTVEPIVIGPAEMPHVVFGGDCDAALAVEEVADVLGAEVTVNARSYGPIMKSSMSNIGGLECSYTTGEAHLELAVIPRTGLEGAKSLTTGSYFEGCNGGQYCSWQGGDDLAWLALTFIYTGMTQEEADSEAAALASNVLANLAAAGEEPWTRDRTGWWPALSCDAVADAVGSQAGVVLTGEDEGFPDIPVPAPAMAAAGSRQAKCILWDDDSETVVGFVRISPGLGAAPLRTDGVPVDLGAPGISAETGPGDSGHGPFFLSDGVNRVEVETYGDTSLGTPMELAVAVAAAAASDFE
jgi:hypothetical protein